MLAEAPGAIDDKPLAELVQQNELVFFPAEWGTIAHNAAQTFTMQDGKLRAELAPGETPPAAGSPVQGVLVVQSKGANPAILHAFDFGAASKAAPAPAVADKEDPLTLWSALAFAFLGGIVLNLMPCVFPVLSIKALALFKHADLTSAQKRWQGIAYTAGVLASFSLLAVALIALKSLGGQVGWGFQFQSPYFVLGVAYLIFVVGLSLSGVFALGGSVANLGSGLAARPGYSGSFFTGVLATIVATPCTAPFMGAALGFALTQSAPVLWLIFTALGLGLALPYLLLSIWPALQAVLPKPGAWMERAKQLLAFPMYGAAVWLVWVLALQAGVNAVPLALGGMVALAILAWVYDITRYSEGRNRLLANAFVVVGACATLAISFNSVGQGQAATPATRLAEGAQAYSPATLAQLREQGKPVFINLTAAWCITCLVNERVALSQAGFKDVLEKEGITYLKGDWTNQDPDISALLKQFGRSGVPLYLFYPAGTESEVVVLPQILTSDIVSSTLQAKQR